MMTPSHALRRPDMCSGISGRRPFCNRWKQVRGLKAHQHILLVARPSMGHDVEAAPALLILCQLGLQHLQSFLIHTQQHWICTCITTVPVYLKAAVETRFLE